MYVVGSVYVSTGVDSTMSHVCVCMCQVHDYHVCFWCVCVSSCVVCKKTVIRKKKVCVHVCEVFCVCKHAHVHACVCVCVCVLGERGESTLAIKS